MPEPPPSREVVFVTQYYRPEVIGSAPFCGDVAEGLAANGWQVSVLTARPHYPEGAVFPKYREGELDRQVLRDVRVERVSTIAFRNGGAVHRMASEGWFLLNGLLALATRRVRRPDVVMSLCPSILSVILGGICRRQGARHIALVHDIQSGLAEGLGMASGLVPRLLRRLERRAFGGCDLVVVLSEEMRQHLWRAGVTTPILVLPVWADTDAIRPKPSAPGPARKALYSGNFGRKQGLMQVIDLAEELRKRGSGLQVVMRGRGNQSDAISRAIASRGLNNVSVTDLRAVEQLGDALAEGDIHLVPQDPAAADYAVPSKIYGIMAAARPFVATARPGSTLWRLHRESGAFLCVEPNEPENFATAVLSLAENDGLRRDMGARGLRYVRAHCSKDSSVAKLMAAVDQA